MAICFDYPTISTLQAGREGPRAQLPSRHVGCYLPRSLAATLNSFRSLFPVLCVGRASTTDHNTKTNSTAAPGQNPKTTEQPPLHMFLGIPDDVVRFGRSNIQKLREEKREVVMRRLGLFVVIHILVSFPFLHGEEGETATLTSHDLKGTNGRMTNPIVRLHASTQARKHARW